MWDGLGEKVNSNWETVLLASADTGPNLVSHGKIQPWRLARFLDPIWKERSDPLSNILHMHMLAGEDDLRDVISAVTDLTGRWKDLGISLGLRPSDLDTILSNNPHSSSDCLREMLLQWLKQSYHVCTTDIPYTRVNNRNSLLSAYWLLSACFFPGFASR